MPYFDVIRAHDTGKPEDGADPSDQYEYVIRGEPGSTKLEALAALRAYVVDEDDAPAGLVLTRCKITANPTDGAEGSDQIFRGTAEFATGERAEDKETGETSYSFDTSGGSFHITQSKGQTGYAEFGSAPDLKRAIGDNGEGPEGVDITIPQFTFSITAYIADEDVTNAYKGVLCALTGTTNDDEFMGLAVGECLFLGARGGKRGRGDWEITFSFAGSPNVTGLSIGDIDGIDKPGWDYLWVKYLKKPVGTGANKRVVSIPQFVYVEQVYDPGDLSLLGIGTA